MAGYPIQQGKAEVGMGVDGFQIHGLFKSSSALLKFPFSIMRFA